MSDGKDWLDYHKPHTKVDITGLALGASYTGWALEYKSMFGMERKLHFNPTAFLSLIGKGSNDMGWATYLGFYALKGINLLSNDTKVHVSDSTSVGVGSSIDVHHSKIHYSSNREKSQVSLYLIGLLAALDLTLVLTKFFTPNDHDGTAAKIVFYATQAISATILLAIQGLDISAKEITYVLTNLEANLAATTSRLKTLAGYETNILDQLHLMAGSRRLHAAKTILESCENDAEKAIKTAKKVAQHLAGGHAP